MSSTLSPALGAERIASLGSDVTEIAFQLGMDANIVCVDDTSLYPAKVQDLPQVGYVRTLAAEGILSCRADLILTAADAGPPAVMAQLRDTGIEIVTVRENYSFEGMLRKIERIALALGVSERGASLIEELRAEMEMFDAMLGNIPTRPKTLFLLSQTPSAVMAAGSGTAADAMMAMAHVDNVASGFAGYKQLTAESAAALAPDYILVADFSAEMLGGIEAMLARPEIALTPAGENRRVISVDALLMLGFGPRIPNAVAAVAQAVHPEFALTFADDCTTP